MKKIKLTKGQYAIVDDNDYEWLNQWKWYAILYKGMNTFYAVRGMRKKEIELNNGKKGLILMARVILKAPKGLQVDHVNRDTLDNRRQNLRLATSTQNHGNSRIPLRNTSGYKGVVQGTKTQKYQAQIKYKGHLYFLGLFDNKQKAALAYNLHAKKFFGVYARLNKIP